MGNKCLDRTPAPTAFNGRICKADWSKSMVESGKPIDSIVVSPKTGKVFTVVQGSQAYLFSFTNVAVPRLITQLLNGHSKAITKADFNSDESFFATSSLDNTAIVWNAETGEKRFGLVGHTQFVVDFDYSKTTTGPSNFLATASYDLSVKVWNANTGALINTLQKHTQPVTGVSFSPIKENVLASCSLDGSVILWNVETGVNIYRMTHPSGAVFKIAFTPDGKFLVAASYDVVIFDVNSGARLPAVMVGHHDVIVALRVSSDAASIMALNPLSTPMLFAESVYLTDLYGQSTTYDSKFFPASGDIVTVGEQGIQTYETNALRGPYQGIPAIGFATTTQTALSTHPTLTSSILTGGIDGSISYSKCIRL